MAKARIWTLMESTNKNVKNKIGRTFVLCKGEGTFTFREFEYPAFTGFQWNTTAACASITEGETLTVKTKNSTYEFKNVEGQIDFSILAQHKENFVEIKGGGQEDKRYIFKYSNIMLAIYYFTHAGEQGEDVLYPMPDCVQIYVDGELKYRHEYTSVDTCLELMEYAKAGKLIENLSKFDYFDYDEDKYVYVSDCEEEED